nr:glutamyl-tRNA reductase-binding protein, chloroplastic-like isoform X2 [Physcomitrium patens]|eukprot:XP_024388101.1 glutamyl-tRNA reductase-binding protein, chloroplastic-like isoform X2 [Physcomitrella patens]
MAAMDLVLNPARLQSKLPCAVLSVAEKQQLGSSTTTRVAWWKLSLHSLFLRPPREQCGGVWESERGARCRQTVAAMAMAEGVVAKEKEEMEIGKLLRPTPAEAARTVMETCKEGTLSTLSEDGWPLGTEVKFVVDMEGNPVLRLQPGALHTQHIFQDSRCSLHVQLEQPGRRKPQCTLQGFMRKVEDIKLKEEEIWVSGSHYWAATADPLRDCANRIVEDMNRHHWEDIRRFCNVYANLDAELEEASMTWVDRLGFDLRVLTKSPQNILEIRVPFTREVADERDARSSLTIMAQVAWKQERSFTPSEVVLTTVEL